MEFRDIYVNGIKVGTLGLPEGSSEEAWHQAESAYLGVQPSWDDVKKIRTKLFRETEWIKLRHKDQQDAGIETSLTPEQYQNWLFYWQALRDIPETFSSPSEVVFPAKPEE